MGKIEYQVLGRGDYAILNFVKDDVFDNAVIPVQAKAFLASDQHHIVVARDAEEVIGMASAVTMLHPDKQPEVFVQEVGVHDDYLRRGIGKHLVRLLIETVNQGGSPDIWLATENDNTAARALYGSLDARETKDIVVYDWGHAMDED